MTKQKETAEKRPVALITGGAKRLGAAIAAYLAARGFALAIHYHQSASAAEALCRSIAAQGGTALPFQADLLTESPAALVESVAERLGAVALLVNNASLFQHDNLENVTKSLWDKHFKLHLEIPVFLTQAVAAAFAAAHRQKPRAGAYLPDSGLIVNMIDQRVLRLNPHFFSYTLSKAALWTATQTMAQSLAPHFRVNAIGPGPVLKNTAQSDADFAAQCAVLPMRQGPNLADFGRTIHYLWETPSVTGQIIAADGGQHLLWQTPDLKWDSGEI